MFYKGCLTCSSHGCLINKSALRCKSTGFILHDYIFSFHPLQHKAWACVTYSLYLPARKATTNQQRSIETYNENLLMTDIFNLNSSALNWRSRFQKKNKKHFSTFFVLLKSSGCLSNSKYLSEIRKTMMLDFLPIFFFFVFNQEYKDLYRKPLDIYTQLHNISTLYTSAHIHAVMHWISIEFPNHLYYISCQVVPRVTRDNLDWHPAERRTLFECVFSPNFFCLSIQHGIQVSVVWGRTESSSEFSFVETGCVYISVQRRRITQHLSPD